METLKLETGGDPGKEWVLFLRPAQMSSAESVQAHRAQGWPRMAFGFLELLQVSGMRCRRRPDNTCLDGRGGRLQCLRKAETSDCGDRLAVSCAGAMRSLRTAMLKTWMRVF